MLLNVPDGVWMPSTELRAFTCVARSMMQSWLESIIVQVPSADRLEVISADLGIGVHDYVGG